MCAPSPILEIAHSPQRGTAVQPEWLEQVLGVGQAAFCILVLAHQPELQTSLSQLTLQAPAMVASPHSESVSGLRALLGSGRLSPC